MIWRWNFSEYAQCLSSKCRKYVYSIMQQKLIGKYGLRNILLTSWKNKSCSSLWNPFFSAKEKWIWSSHQLMELGRRKDWMICVGQFNKIVNTVKKKKRRRTGCIITLNGEKKYIHADVRKSYEMKKRASKEEWKWQRPLRSYAKFSKDWKSSTSWEDRNDFWRHRCGRTEEELPEVRYDRRIIE